MARLNVMPLAVSLVSLVFIISCIQSYFHYGLDRGDAERCSGISMIPSYRRVHFTSENSKMGSKYRLCLYGEVLIDMDEEAVVSENGIPVLFVAGSAGNYSQGRSLASFCAKRTHSDRQVGSSRRSATRERAKFRGDEEAFESNPSLGDIAPKFDFFLAGFNGDFTAFHGRTVVDQALYLNDAIAHILSMYDGQANPPKSVIVVGHSMGGIVARALVTLPNYVPGSVNTIITFSTPHTLPPLSFDGDMVTVYDTVNQFWRQAFSNTTGESASDLSSVSLVSITGGPSDGMVPSDYTSVSSLVPPSNGFSVFSHSIPGVWMGIDHLAIVWCDELRKVVGNALFDIADYSSPDRTVPISERMHVLRQSLLSGLEKAADLYEYQVPSRQLVVDNWTGDNVAVTLGNGEQMHITRYDKRATFFYKSMTAGRSALICHKFGDREEDHLLDRTTLYKEDLTRAHFLSLNEVEDLESSPAPVDMAELNVEPAGVTLLCRQLEDSAAVMPAPTELEHPFRSESRLLLRLSEEEYDQDPILIRFSSGERGYDAVVDVPMDSAPIKVTDTWMHLILSSLEIPLWAHYTDICLPGTASSLVTYSVSVKSNLAELHSGSCSVSPTFANFLGTIRQSLDGDSEESKLHLNVLKKTSLLISAHGPSPYMPYLHAPSLHLQAILPPVTCAEDSTPEAPYTMIIHVDIRASLANIVLRYRTLFAVFPLAVTALILIIQFQSFANKGIFISFGDAISLYTRAPLLATVVCAALVHGLVCSRHVRSLLVALRLPYEGRSLAAMKAFDPLLEQNDLFLGVLEPSLWPLASIFVLTAAGICFAVYFAVSRVVYVLAISVSFVLKSRLSQASNDMEKTRTGKYLTYQLIDHPQILPQLALFSAALIWIPYQVSFLGATIWQAVNVVQLRRIQLSMGPGDRKLDSNGYNIAMSLLILFVWCSTVDAPVLVVWIFNLSPRWAYSFASFGNIFNVLPVFVAIRVSRNYTLPPLTAAKKHVTITMLLYMATYAFLHGVLHTYVLHHMVNLFSLWIVILWLS